MTTKSTLTTMLRYFVIGASMLMAVLLYLDRFCISFAEIFIKEDLNLTDKQIAWVLSAFFWSYALFQVPSGWLSDKYGARIMLTLYIITWSIFTALTGLAIGFIMLIVLRLGFGIGQAGAYPTSANIVSKWVPLTERGLASSFVAVGGRLGGALAPLLTAFLIALFVPVSSSSLLTTNDILDAPSLAIKLLHHPQGQNSRNEKIATDKSQFRLRLLGSLLPESQDVLEELVGQSEKLSQSNQLSNQPSTHIMPQPLADSPTSSLFIEDLNRVLSSVTLYDLQSFAKINLDDQAEKLSKLPDSELTMLQRQRLNRLLLEAYFPGEVRKIYGRGWRPVMYVYGLLGLVVAVIFWWIVRDSPRMHTACSEAEIEKIEAGREVAHPDEIEELGAAPVWPMIKSRSIWLICISQLCTNIGWVFLVTWLPRFLEETHNVPLKTRGYMVTIPMVIGWFGMILGGRITDWLIPHVGLRWSRSLPIVCSRFLAMFAYAYCLTNPSPWLAVAAFAVIAFATDMGSPAMWAFNQDVGGRHVGSVLGWGNMWGNLGAAITPPLLIAVIGSGDSRNWNLAFIVCGFAFLIAGLASLGIDASQPLDIPNENQNKEQLSA